MSEHISEALMYMYVHVVQWYSKCTCMYVHVHTCTLCIILLYASYMTFMYMYMYVPYSGYFSRGGNFRDIRGRLISANIKLAKNYTGEIFNPLITTPAYSSATTCYGVAAVL